ncbi:hypothetical protein ACVWW2_008064 [Bradyrhizobium sp. LM4.3]
MRPNQRLLGGVLDKVIDVAKAGGAFLRIGEQTKLRHSSHFRDGT